MPWAEVLMSLLSSLASSGKSSKDQSYNVFLRSVANKVMSDKAKEKAATEFETFVNG